MPYFKKNMLTLAESVMLSMRSKIYKTYGSLNTEVYTSPEPLSYPERRSGVHKKLQKGDAWGSLFDCGWFHFTAEVPKEVQAAEAGSACMLIDVSGEGCIFDENGTPVQGITCVESGYEKRIGMSGKRVVKPPFPVPEAVDFWMDAGCNDLMGNFHGTGTLKQAEFAICHKNLRSLFYDFQVLLEFLKALDPASPRYNRILFRLYDAALLLQTFSEEEISKAKNMIAPELSKQGGDPSLRFTAVGHAHIDLAWLWPIRETIRKAARTFSTALRMMEEYPDYVFGASQPQLYKWVKDYYPALYEQVKARVKEGRFEIQGAMWVESDTNLVSGESLVRQILYGKQFFREEFGITVDSLWLPDVFGYSAALPQILKKTRTPYFMTQKLSWSEHNRFPHQTFLWEGIDGSRILTHMLPEETYNSSFTPLTVRRGEYNYHDSGQCEDALILFGIGDGGGGPGREHLERASRMKNLEGLAPVEQKPSSELFKSLEKNRSRLKVWQGELYLEKHQGTYTSQSRNKQYNRRMELALREAEFALTLSNTWTDEIKSELDMIWQEVLLYQFHDIIPGSSIKRVYDECLERYAHLTLKTEEIIENAYKSISTKNGSTVFNSLSWDRTLYLDGKVLTVPSMGYTSLSLAEDLDPDVSCGDLYLENRFFKVYFASDGSILQIFDKRSNRDVLKAPANILRVYREEHRANAWDINLTYLDSPCEAFILVSQACKVINEKACMVQEFVYSNSRIKMTVSLSALDEWVNFDLEADWQEALKMLRTSFTANLTMPKSTCEIQFGKLSRPNHENTSWDAAKFEVSGQKWVDLSQPDYGVALLNKEKYGYRILRDCIDINLIRSQNHPGKQGDIAVHRISYALCPHSGDETDANIQKKAMEYNIPLRVYGEGKKISEKNTLFFVSNDVIIDTVKRSEDGQSIILRIFEPHGKNAKVALKAFLAFSEAQLCNLLEEPEEKLEVQKGEILLNAAPFEILTVKIT